MTDVTDVTDMTDMTDMTEGTLLSLEERRQLRRDFVAPIRERLEERGSQQKWLAARTGYDRRIQWRYLNGFERVPAEWLERACKALDLWPSQVPLTGPRDVLIQPRPGRATVAMLRRHGTQGGHADASRRVKVSVRVRGPPTTGS